VVAIVIVAALVIVVAPVVVAALVNGNDHVAVIDAVDASRIDQLRQHRDDTLAQLDAIVEVQQLQR
jgi:hypothetical protein